MSFVSIFHFKIHPINQKKTEFITGKRIQSIGNTQSLKGNGWKLASIDTLKSFNIYSIYSTAKEHCLQLHATETGYSRILFSRTSKGNKHWFKKSGVKLQRSMSEGKKN